MTAPAQDERLGLPSGSGAFRWLSCPGSHLIEQTQPDDETDYAAEGEKLHAVLAGKLPPTDLTEEQAGCVMFCQHQTERLMHDLLGEGAKIVDKDQTRYWLRDAALDPVGSCLLDYIATDAAGSKFLILDFKFGRREVDPADTNAQLRFAATVAGQEWSPDSVFVGIIAPRAEGEKVTVAEFRPDQIKAAHKEMTAGAQRAMLPDQPRNPSAKACHYCRAKGVCPDAIKETTALATVKLGELASPEELAVLLEKCELADRVIETIRNSAKMRLTAGQEIPGWRLKPGNTVKTISDARAAWSKVGIQIGGACFADCCKVSLPALATAWKEQSPGKKSEKVARAEVEAMLNEAGAIQEKQNAPSLAREVNAA